MKSLFLSLVLSCLCIAAFATTVTVNATSSGYATAGTKTSGAMIVTTSQRGYAVFDLAAAGIPAAATITSVKVSFTYTISGAGNPTRTIYGYVGDISALSAASLYTGAITANTLYTASWGISATTKTMNSTAAADTFLAHNRTNTISLTWVQSASTRVYTIAGAPSPVLTIVYTCVTPSAVSVTASANPVCSGSSETLTGNATGATTYNWAGPNGFTSTVLIPAAFTTSTLSAGVYTFTATSNCAISTVATLALAVKTVPGTISGATQVCIGATTPLTNPAGFGTWSRSSSRVTVNSTTGIVMGLSAGAVNVTYSTGCGSGAVQNMTVITAPAAIGGASVVCVGSTTALTNATAGGTWSTGDVAIASVSGAGVVTGTGAGSVTISYTNSCGTSTKAMTVGIAPGAITGSSTICVGASATLTNSIPGGTWSSSITSKVTIGAATGIMTGVATGGSPVITYTTGCGSNVTLAITVNASPAAISGAGSVCTGSSTTLTDATASGTWSTSNAGLASISSGGSVTGIAQGAVVITYTKTGCFVTKAVNVKTTPSAISGASTICTGTTIVLTNTSLFGTWTTSNAGVASVNSVGTATGVAAGSATITYSTGCGTAATKAETVSNTPAAITGTTTVCTSATTTLANATGGGTWSSSNNSIASVTSGGMVAGIGQGNVTISYAIASCVATASVLVKTAPAAITGTAAICNGSTSTLFNTSTNGTWSTANSAIASINASGFVSSVAPGTTTITYTTGCGSNATRAVSIDVVPDALSGTTTLCSGNSTTLTEAIAGGTWSTANAAIATVDGAGLVTGTGAGTVAISYSLNNGCGLNVVSQNMNVSLAGLWLGTNTDWNDAANWPCGAVPDATINVLIPSGTPFLPDFTAADFYVKNLTIASGVTIPVSGDATINVKGNLTNNGTFNGDGAVIMNGAAIQTIYGKGNVSNLTINNGAGVTINTGDTTKITTDLTLTNGALTTNGGIVLVSTAVTSGRIAPVTGGTISGNVTVQQYFQGGRRAFRFFGHPFSSSIALNQIITKLDITGAGGAGNGFTTSGSNAASSFRYNPTIGNASLPSDPGWKPFANANANVDSNEFKKYQGIRLFVRGAKGEGLGYGAYTPSPVTIAMSGTVNTGTQVVTLHKGSNSDYNMISNPYPSATNIGNVIAAAQTAGQVTGSAFYVWNPFLGSAGGYQAQPIGGSYIMDQNTSFQVRATNEGSVLTFNESHKSAAAGDAALLRTAAQPYITLNITDGAGHPWDMTYIGFNENATAGEDNTYDAVKSVNPDLNFYSLAGSSKLSIDARPYNEATIIPLGLTTSYAQQYVIKASNVVLPSSGSIYLHDKMLGQYVQLVNGTEYSFAVTADKASQGENRFELTTTPATTTTATVTSFKATMQPNPATAQVTISFTATEKANTTVRIMNVSGVTVATKDLGVQQAGKATIALTELPAGIYMVEITSGGNKSIQQLVKE